MLKRFLIARALLLIAALSAATAAAEEMQTSQVFDQYEVHYSIFNTSFLTPEVAEAYGITRSKSKALVNIAVLEKQADGSRKNVSAIISGEQYDLIRHTPLAFQEVREEQALYYLATVDIQHKVTVYFTLNIQPDPNRPPYQLKFSKLLYRDE